MPKHIGKTNFATADIRKLAKYYRTAVGLNVALTFVTQTESEFKKLSEAPRLGAILGFMESRFANIRSWQINGFDRLIILYREAGDGVEIVRVIDGTRDFATLLRN